MDFDKTGFADLLTAFSSDAPTPGGGTAAALTAAMGAALAEMVAALTLSKEKYAAVHEAVRPIAGLARRSRMELQRLAHEDAEAYDAVVAARRLPKDTPDQQKVRARKTSEANHLAADVPMRTARAAARLLAALPDLAEEGQPQRRVRRGRRGPSPRGGRPRRAPERRNQPGRDRGRGVHGRDARRVEAARGRSRKTPRARSHHGSRGLLAAGARSQVTPTGSFAPTSTGTSFFA